MEVKDAYRRSYSLRVAIPGKKSAEVTFPYEVIEREARRRDITAEEFIRQYQVVAQFDNFDGVFYSFEPRPVEEVRSEG